MKETRILMDMPVTVELEDGARALNIVEKVYDYFNWVDKTFSTFKPDSEISRFNRGELKFGQLSVEMKEVLRLSEETKNLSQGYFDIKNPKTNLLDPSGLVKGWAIYNAALLVKKEGLNNFYVDAGGDIQVFGRNLSRQPWTAGIRNPFNRQKIVKVVYLKNNEGIATSGTYIRGDHVYNPLPNSPVVGDIVSLTVIGPNIYEADRFATAALAMGRAGIDFIQSLPGFEGYQIDKSGQAKFTSNFKKYLE